MNLRNLLTSAWMELTASSRRGMVTRAASATALIKLIGGALAFLASVFLARVLGAHDYGLFAYVIACASVLTVPAGLGLGKYIVREGSRLPERLTALRRWADRWIWRSGLIAAGALVIAGLIPASGSARWLFLAASPLPLLANLAVVRQSILQAHGFVSRSQWPQLVLAPGASLVALFGWWMWRGSLEPIEVVVASTLAALLWVVVSSAQARRITPKDVPVHPWTASIRHTLPFMWLGGVYLIMNRTDIIMLGPLQGAEHAGVYSVASRMSEALSLVAFAANVAIAPHFAKLHADHAALQRIFTAMRRRVLLLTAPPAAAVVIFADQLIYLLYGSQYTAGATALRILGITQLLVVSGGSVATLLNMAGLERSHLKAAAFGAAANVALNALLIPKWGLEGAALATGLSVLATRLLMQRTLRHDLGMKVPLL